MINLGLETSTGKSPQYRPAYLEHFEKLELQNQRNIVGNRRVNENMLKGADQHTPGKFLGPIDFEFVSFAFIRLNLFNYARKTALVFREMLYAFLCTIDAN